MKMLKATLVCLVTLQFSCCLQGVTSQGIDFQLVVISNQTMAAYGRPVLLTCGSFYEANVSITTSWLKDNTTLFNTSSITISEWSHQQGGRQYIFSFLQLCRVQPSDLGSYTCLVRSSYLGRTNVSTVEVVPVAEVTFGFLKPVYTVSDTNSNVSICLNITSNSTLSSNFMVTVETLNLTALDGIDFDRTDVVLAFGPNTLPPELCFGVPIIYDFERDSTVSFTVRANSMNAWALTTTTTAAVNIVPVYQGDFEIIEVSNDTTIDRGDSVELTCEVSYGRDAHIAITWVMNGQTVYNSSTASTSEEGTVLEEQRRIRISRLRLSDVDMSAAGIYDCSVRSGSSNVNASVHLQVATPLRDDTFELVLISNSTTADAGNYTELTCAAYYKLNANISISWWKEGKVINSSMDYLITEEKKFLGERWFMFSTLQICEVEEMDAGNYTCSVSNGTVKVSEQVELLVKVPQSLMYEYSLVMPNGNSTEEGSSIAVCVTASETLPTRMYPLISIAGSSYTVFGKDFIPSPRFLILEESQNMTCFNLTVNNNSVYMRDYYIIATLHSVQMSDESTIIPYTNLKSVIISVDDSEDAGLPEPVAPQLDDFIPFGVERGDSVLPLCSPTCAFKVLLPSSFPYLGRRYSKFIINGTLIGGFMEDSYSLLMVPFWVGELAQTGNIFFNNMTEIPSLKEQIESSFGMDNYDALYYFYVTWYRVATSLDNPKVNTFQLILTTNGAESFASFHYGLIEVKNFRNGFSSGQIPDSSMDGSAALTGTNALVNGQYLYKIDSSSVEPPKILPMGNNETNSTTASEGLTSAEAGSIAAGVTVASAAVVGTAIVGVKVASSAIKKPPLPNVESLSPQDDLGNKNVKGEKSKKQCCTRCIKKMLRKLKQCLCRKKRRRRGKGRVQRADGGKKKNKSSKKKSEGVTNSDASESQYVLNVVTKESLIAAVRENEYVDIVPINIGSEEKKTKTKEPNSAAIKDKKARSKETKKVPTEDIVNKANSRETSRKPKSKSKPLTLAIPEDFKDLELECTEDQKRKLKSSNKNGQATASTSTKVKSKKKTKTSKKVRDEKGLECAEENLVLPQMLDENEHIYETVA